jgi:hypothetical protein
MPNDMDKVMDMMHDSSAAMASHAAENGVTKDQLIAAGDAATQQQAQDLLDQELRELMQADPSSTVGQPGDASTQKYIYAPPRNVIVMPKIDLAKRSCHENSWWSKKILPVPMNDMDFTSLIKKKMIAPGTSEMDAKYPPTINNFPIKFDRLLGYREFLS